MECRVAGRTRPIAIAALGLVALAAAALGGVLDLHFAIPAAAALWWLALRASEDASAGWVLAAALVLHGLLATTSFHSNDLHRYLWEGEVQLHGASPYARAPNDPSLAPLRDARYPHVVYPELPTPYPPLAQATFVAAAAAGWDERTYRDAILVCNLGLIALLFAWLRASGRPQGRVAFYAWSPVALASAAGGHVDVVMVAALVGFAWTWESGRYRLAGALLAAAILAKLVALLLLPWALWRRPRAALVTTLPLVGLGYAPYIGEGNLLGSLPVFASEFEFNAFVHPWLGHAFASGATLAAAAGLAGWVAWWTLREDAPADAVALIMLGLLVLSPVVHYWYLTWFLALLPAVRRPALRWGGLAWAASISTLAPVYLALARGETLPPMAERVVAEAVIPIGVAALVVLREASGRVGGGARQRGGADALGT